MLHVESRATITAHAVAIFRYDRIRGAARNEWRFCRLRHQFVNQMHTHSRRVRVKKVRKLRIARELCANE